MWLFCLHRYAAAIRFCDGSQVISVNALCSRHVGFKYTHVHVFSWWRKACFSWESWPNVLQRDLRWPIGDLKLYFQRGYCSCCDTWSRVKKKKIICVFTQQQQGQILLSATPVWKWRWFPMRRVWNQEQNGRAGAETDSGTRINRGWEHLTRQSCGASKCIS